MIYEFQSLKRKINCLAQSPALDVVAIGLMDGTIILHNLKVDQQVIQFKQGGSVTAITFRTGKLFFFFFFFSKNYFFI